MISRMSRDSQIFQPLISQEGVSHQNNFDAIRLLMALLVVWSHSFALHEGTEANEPVSLLLNGAYNAGNIGVYSFFIISGFLITVSFAHSKSVFQFMIRRIRRIYPGFLVALAICAFVVIPLYSTIADFSPAEIAKTIVLGFVLQGHFPPSNVFAGNVVPNVVNGSLWSIPYEFWCYIGVAALGLLGLLFRPVLTAAATAAVLMLRVAFDVLDKKPGLGIIGDIFGWPYLWTIVLPFFLIGMTFYNFRTKIPRSPVILASGLVLAITICHVNQHLAHLVFPVCLAYALFYAAYADAHPLRHITKYGDFS